MGCNLYKCGSAIFVEGMYIGPFETIQVDSTRDDMVEQCTITLPMYAWFNSQVEKRILQEGKLRLNLLNAPLIPSARIDVFTWYYQLDYYTEQMPVVNQFSGFIKKVVNGFPSQIFCEDFSYMLRFGKLTQDWGKSITLKELIEKIIPVSQTAFNEYRESKAGLGKKDWIPELTYDSTLNAEMEIPLQSLNGVSPYEVMLRLMKDNVLYANVYETAQSTMSISDGVPEIEYPSNGKALVYMGLGIKEKNKTKPTVNLSTQTNVIARDLVAENAMFDNILVQVNGLVDGKRVSVTPSNTASIKLVNGKARRKYSPLTTKDGLQEVADAAYWKLVGDQNKGTITTVLYPHINLFDHVIFVDTMFREWTGRYYCIGRNFSGSPDKGFQQTITVTNEVFIL